MTDERIEQIREHLEAHHLHYLADECHELLSEVERLRGLTSKCKECGSLIPLREIDYCSHSCWLDGNRGEP